MPLADLPDQRPPSPMPNHLMMTTMTSISNPQRAHQRTLLLCGDDELQKSMAVHHPSGPTLLQSVANNPSRTMPNLKTQSKLVQFPHGKLFHTRFLLKFSVMPHTLYMTMQLSSLSLLALGFFKLLACVNNLQSQRSQSFILRLLLSLWIRHICWWTCYKRILPS